MSQMARRAGRLRRIVLLVSSEFRKPRSWRDIPIAVPSEFTLVEICVLTLFPRGSRPLERTQFAI